MPLIFKFAIELICDSFFDSSGMYDNHIVTLEAIMGNNYRKVTTSGTFQTILGHLMPLSPSTCSLNGPQIFAFQAVRPLSNRMVVIQSHTCRYFHRKGFSTTLTQSSSDARWQRCHYNLPFVIRCPPRGLHRFPNCGEVNRYSIYETTDFHIGLLHTHVARSFQQVAAVQGVNTCVGAYGRLIWLDQVGVAEDPYRDGKPEVTFTLPREITTLGWRKDQRMNQELVAVVE